MNHLSHIMDTIDQKILSELEKDSRLSTNKLAKRTGIPQTTIHHRIKKLLAEGVITRYTIITDLSKVGRPVMAYVLVLFDTTTMKEKKWTYESIAESIGRIPGVEEFAYTTGRYDIIIKVTAGSMKELSSIVLDKLRKIPGVSRTESVVVMDYFGKALPLFSTSH